MGSTFLSFDKKTQITRKVAGPASVGIGGDYNGVSEYPAGLEDVSGFPKVFQALMDDKVTQIGCLSLINDKIKSDSRLD